MQYSSVCRMYHCMAESRSTVLYPCCHSAIPLALASLRPASDVIILLLNDILVQCTSCGRNMRTGAFVGHECTS